MNPKTRCAWVTGDPLYIAYHDQEWGRPIYDERLLFEFLILEGMQAGLSWFTILKKRENYRLAFGNFDAEKIALYPESKIQELMLNTGIIRNTLKIRSIISNAQAFLKLKKEGLDFATYLWTFVGGEPIKNHFKKGEILPSTSLLSDRLSKDLKKRGFKFVGSTICYAFMQAVGMLDDHASNCFRYGCAQ